MRNLFAMTGPRYTPLIASLPSTVPFVGPEVQERERGHAFAARLGANENVFGPSPIAVKAMQNAVPETWMYGDSASHDLRTALAAHHNVTMDNIVIGAGIDGLLGSLVRMTVTAGDKVVTSTGAYPTFNYHVNGFGGELVQVPYKNDMEDPDALLAKAAEVDAKLVYFANPDNPMGTCHSAEVIANMINRVPDGCLLVLDEAYVEFAPEGTAPPMNPDDPRVIRMRTFSKAYGMAGARVAYAIGHSGVIDAFNKVRNHFGVNRIAVEGALAALADQDWLESVKARVHEANERIAQIAGAHGLSALPTATNFVTIDCGRDGDYAKRVVSELVARGVFVRMPFVEPQNRCIRISAGTKTDLDEFEIAFPEALKGAS